MSTMPLARQPTRGAADREVRFREERVEQFAGYAFMPAQFDSSTIAAVT